MAAMTLDPLSLQTTAKESQQRVVSEEIDGLIKVYKDGRVERPDIVPRVTCSLHPEFGVTSKDLIIDKYTNIWARLYVPNSREKLPLMVYFHGGGFCVGSASWSCYHEFLAKLSAKANCAILSVNYRLAPENPLPAAYEDGVKAFVWLRQQVLSRDNELLTSKCNFSSIFLAGDSAGANIAYNVTIRLSRLANLRSSDLKGLILIQPFFGGESRTHSEKYMVQPPRSALTLAASDTYWRLSLPAGANRDHPWSNPVAKGAEKLEDLPRVPTMVCISEMDILKDRNLEFCAAMESAGKKVEHVVYKGVGHAFQILNKSSISHTRINELICHIKSFISR
ncbi:unnamed protein product [Fraxinus pennsylvanica]|uniref:Alpha/beta hydrolase fold-3 domain-containing protein n=1 Tax=Fraxinus pennsylvanica TaxID=56036 RepID=A0AAD1YR90_9LAMI|nr:unnamed protein product [Fraxinus pennsylvanica]